MTSIKDIEIGVYGPLFQIRFYLRRHLPSHRSSQKIPSKLRFYRDLKSHSVWDPPVRRRPEPEPEQIHSRRESKIS